MKDKLSYSELCFSLNLRSFVNTDPGHHHNKALYQVDHLEKFDYILDRVLVLVDLFDHVDILPIEINVNKWGKHGNSEEQKSVLASSSLIYVPLKKSKDREVTKLRTEQRSSVLSHDWSRVNNNHQSELTAAYSLCDTPEVLASKLDPGQLPSIEIDQSNMYCVTWTKFDYLPVWQNKMDILSEGEKRKFINRSKSIHPENNFGFFKLLNEITTSDKTEDELILCESVEKEGSKSQQIPDLVQICDFCYDVPDAKEIFVTNFKKQLFQFQSGQYSVAANLLKILCESVEKEGSKSQQIPDLVQICDFCYDVPDAKEIFVTNFKKQLFQFQSGQYSVAANLLKILCESVEEEEIIVPYISKSQQNPDLAQICGFCYDVPSAKELSVKFFKKQLFQFQSGQYSVAANLLKTTDVSSEKRSRLIGKSDAVNKRIEKNPHFLAANVEFKLQTRNHHYKVADINLKYTVIKVRIYSAVMGNVTHIMMISIDTLESVTFDLLGTERKRVFFDLLDHRLLRFESSATISDFIPNMFDPTVIQEVIYFPVHELGLINRLKALLLSCPDGERLQQRSKQEFISLIQAVVGATFKETTTRRPIFSMVDSEVFGRALEGISRDFVNNSQPEERAIVPVVDNVRHEGNGASETIVSRPVQCIYFPSDCRLFIYIPTENGSYWHQLDMQRASRLNPTSPAVTNP